MSAEASMFQAQDAAMVYIQSNGHDLPVKELPLPSDFGGGTAIASYQVEGGDSEEKREYRCGTHSRTLNPRVRTAGMHA
jgi:hypothetical protein